MIVFNLACSQQHVFDGWFRSADDFDAQTVRGMVECPICGDQAIQRRLSAPRINVGASQPVASDSDGTGSQDVQEVVAASMLPGLQAHMLKQFKEFVMANTDNVGADFAEVARRMHYGEEAQRNIRGRISPEESQALRDEGIETVGLPPGLVLDESLQ